MPELTAEELTAIRARHQIAIGDRLAYDSDDDRLVCAVCEGDWPCRTARLVGHIDALQAKLDRAAMLLAWLAGRQEGLLFTEQCIVLDCLLFRDPAATIEALHAEVAALCQHGLMVAKGQE